MSQSDRDNCSNWDEKSHKTAQSDQDSYSSWDEKSHKTTQRHHSVSSCKREVIDKPLSYCLMRVF